MKKWTLTFLFASLAAVSPADVVELKDGTRVEGRILAENADSIEIQVGANEAGTIRRVLIIHSSEISTWTADRTGRIHTSDDGKMVNRQAGTEYVERLLREAEVKIQERKYDEGIAQFEEAAAVAIRNVDTMEPADRLAALGIRAHALRLMLAALKGKEELLEAKSEGVLDELEERRDKLERDWEDLQDEKNEFEDSDDSRRNELGSGRKRNEFDDREKELRTKIETLKRREVTIGARARMLEEESVRTRGQVTLVEERVDQAEGEVEQAQDTLKQAERDARRR